MPDDLEHTLDALLLAHLPAGLDARVRQLVAAGATVARVRQAAKAWGLGPLMQNACWALADRLVAAREARQN